MFFKHILYISFYYWLLTKICSILEFSPPPPSPIKDCQIGRIMHPWRDFLLRIARSDILCTPGGASYFHLHPHKRFVFPFHKLVWVLAGTYLYCTFNLIILPKSLCLHYDNYIGLLCGVLARPQLHRQGCSGIFEPLSP